MHYWADLQSVHRFRCYDNIVPNAKRQRVLALTLCLIYLVNEGCKQEYNVQLVRYESVNEMQLNREG